MKIAKVLALVLGLFLASCASSTVKSEVDREYQSRYSYGGRVGNWFLDRWFDLTDVVQADISFGQGLQPTWPLVNVHVTEFAQIGMGWSDTTRVGLKERAFGVWDERRKEYGLGPFYHLDIDREASFGTELVFAHNYQYTGWDLLEDPVWKEHERDWFDVGAAVHFVVIGAQVNFATFEAADFIFGLNPLGLILTLFNYNDPIWDFMDDDRYSRVEAELMRERGLGE